MIPSIKFDHVSKKYRLGLTRSSIPSILSSRLRKALKGGSGQSNDEKTLWALNDVSFELNQGESLALVGANGAGKTTVLKLLANITKPTSGSIKTNGQLSALIELGAGFHPDLTGRENIFLNGTILGLDRQTVSSHFEEIVAFSELERFIDTPVKRYSSGMIVRLGFAVASCIEPEILLVDEVLAVGDASFQQKCLDRIRTLINGGTSIIFVSHNFYLVQAVCRTALYLQNGQLKQLGATNDVIEMYEQDLHQERSRKFGVSADESVEGNEDIEITRVDVLNEEGLKAELLFSDQPAHIQIHYNAYKHLGNIQASAFIIRSDGLTCSMMRTKLDDFSIFVEKGQGIISLYVEPIQLVGGTYYVSAWFLDEADSMAITSAGHRSDWFTVKGAALSYEESSGVYEANARWRHREVDGSHEISKYQEQGEALILDSVQSRVDKTN